MNEYIFYITVFCVTFFVCELFIWAFVTYKNIQEIKDKICK